VCLGLVLQVFLPDAREPHGKKGAAVPRWLGGGEARRPRGRLGASAERATARRGSFWGDRVGRTAGIGGAPRIYRVRAAHREAVLCIL